MASAAAKARAERAIGQSVLAAGLSRARKLAVQHWRKAARGDERHGLDLPACLEQAERICGLPRDSLRALVQAELPASYHDAFGIERWNDYCYRRRIDVVHLIGKALERLG